MGNRHETNTNMRGLVPMRPVPESDGHDPPGLVCDFVPSLAAVIDDVVVVLEDAIGQVVVSHELPEVFDGVQLW